MHRRRLAVELSAGADAGSGLQLVLRIDRHDRRRPLRLGRPMQVACEQPGQFFLELDQILGDFSAVLQPGVLLAQALEFATPGISQGNRISPCEYPRFTMLFSRSLAAAVRTTALPDIADPSRRFYAGCAG